MSIEEKESGDVLAEDARRHVLKQILTTTEGRDAEMWANALTILRPVVKLEQDKARLLNEIKRMSGAHQLIESYKESLLLQTELVGAATVYCQLSDGASAEDGERCRTKLSDALANSRAWIKKHE